MGTFKAYAPLCSPSRIVLTAAREQIRHDNYPDSSISIRQLNADGQPVPEGSTYNGVYQLTVRVHDLQERWAQYALRRRGFETEYPNIIGGSWHEEGCQKPKDMPPTTRPESASSVSPHGLGRGNPVNWFRDRQDQPNARPPARRDRPRQPHPKPDLIDRILR